MDYQYKQGKHFEFPHVVALHIDFVGAESHDFSTGGIGQNKKSTSGQALPQIGPESDPLPSNTPLRQPESSYTVTRQPSRFLVSGTNFRMQINARKGTSRSFPVYAANLFSIQTSFQLGFAVVQLSRHFRDPRFVKCLQLTPFVF
jgi:hypothetical protein